MVGGSLAIGGPCSTCRAKTTSATRSTSRGHQRDGPRRSSSRILPARDTVRAHKQVGGSSGSTRVRLVDLVDLRGLVHEEYLRVDPTEGSPHFAISAEWGVRYEGERRATFRRHVGSALRPPPGNAPQRPDRPRRPVRVPGVPRVGGPKSVNPRAARPADRPHRPGGWGHQLAHRNGPQRRGSRRSRRAGLPRPLRQAHLTAI